MRSSVNVLSAGILSVAITVSMGCGGSKPAGAPNPTAGNGGGTAGTSNADTGGGTAGTGGGTAGTGTGTGTAGTGIGTAGTTGTAGTGVATKSFKDMFPDVTDWGALEIVYPTMYSAYVEGQSFKVPARVRCASVSVDNWYSDPPGAVTFDADPDNANGVMITIVEPVENITIAAINGKVAGTAPLKVTLGTPELWAMGEERYNNGSDWTLNLLDPKAPPPDTKCTVCHSANSSTTFDIQHTPTQAARISDEGLEQIMTTGTKPADVEFRVLPPTIMFGTMTYTNAELYKKFHLWDTTDDGIKGMILYLRSLTPRGQGCVTNPQTMVCEDVDTAPDAECK